MEIQLVVASGSKKGLVIPIHGSKFIVGRAEDCHLKPRSELISRYHCTIISEDGYAAVRDLASKNGVYLNGERVSLESELKNGDKLNIGPLEFVVNISVSTKGTKRPKVESVEDAVARTVEIGTEQKQTEEDADIADWLYSGNEDSDIYDQDTRTVQIQRGDPQDYSPESEEEIPSQEAEEKSQNTPAEGLPKNIPNQAATGRDAAANLLKNFFKGGR